MLRKYEKAAMKEIRKRGDGYEITEIREDEGNYYFFWGSTDHDEVMSDNNPIAVSKRTLKVRSLYLPSKKNFEVLEKANVIDRSE